MNSRTKLLTPEAGRLLTERLSRIPAVRKFDLPGEPQAATIAHALSDLEESFRTTLEHLLPRVVDSQLTSDELNDVLLDIGEELRHILYHVKDPRFFDYLFEDKRA